MASLRVAVLGTFEVKYGADRLVLPDSSGRLLAYLALSYGRMVRRSQVAGALWPDLSENRARANLSTVLWRLRRAFRDRGCAETVLKSTATSLGLNPTNIEVDAELFKVGTSAHGLGFTSLNGLSRAVQAVELYRGELLADWDVEWCIVEREQLRGRYLGTLRSLAEGFERLCRYDLAMRFARRAAEEDPYSEEAQRLLIRLMARMGDRVAAIDQFNRFASLARRDLGVEPSEETQRLLNDIRTAKTKTMSYELRVSSERVPIVGRTEERRRIVEFFQAVLSRRGGGLLLTGDAGIGKSRLVEWGVEEWTGGGGAVGFGRCIEFNAPIPYQPILEAISSIADVDDLVSLGSPGYPRVETDLHELSSVDLGADAPNAQTFAKLQLFSQIRKRLIGASQQRPVLIAVEDLQWADAGTLDLLVFLLQQLKGAQIGVLLTSRPVASKGRRLSSPDGVARHCDDAVHLAPLTQEDARRLVQALLDSQDVPSALTDLIYSEAEGNPLFVIETLRLICQRHDAVARGSERVETRVAGSQAGTHLDIPSGVRSAVQQRLALVGPLSRKVASIASVLGRSFDEDLLIKTAGVSANRLSRAMIQLLGAGILEREGERYRFAHDKIRAVCYEDMPARVRRLQHARAAAALSLVPETPMPRLAWHLLCAGQWNLARASWKQAGDDARALHAHEDALHAYQCAVHCARRDGTLDATARMREELGFLLDQEDVLAILGRPSERVAVLSRAAAISERLPGMPLQSLLLSRRARLEDHVGNSGIATSYARKAWAVGRAKGDRLAVAEALRVLAWILSRTGRYARSLVVSRLALRELGGTYPSLAATVLWQAAVASTWLGDHLSAAAFLKRARGVLLESGCAFEDPVILIAQAVLDKWSGNLNSAREGLAKALRLSEDVSDLVATSRAACSLAILNCLDGKLGAAIRLLRKALLASRASEHTRSQAICLNTVASSVGRVVGNHTWAWNASNHAIRLLANGGGAKLAAFYRDSQVQLLIDEGRFREARDSASDVLVCFRSERGSSLHAELLARKGRIELEMAELSVARSDLETARAVQHAAGERLQLVDTLTYLAVAYAKLGEAERALATSEEAIRLLTEIGFANLQPQRIFWHHYLILEQFNREPRLDYLRRAVELIEERGATLSRAQRRRFERDVALNREILNAWHQYRQALGAEQTTRTDVTPGRDRTATGVPAAVRVAAGAAPAIP